MRSWKFYSAAVLSTLCLTSAVLTADDATSQAPKKRPQSGKQWQRAPRKGGRFDRNVMMMSMLAKPELDAYLADKTPENLKKLEDALKAAYEKQLKEFLTKVQKPDFKLPQMPGRGGRGQGKGGFPPRQP